MRLWTREEPRHPIVDGRQSPGDEIRIGQNDFLGAPGHHASAGGLLRRRKARKLAGMRAIADGEETGFVKIHLQDRSDRILGATIVARHAGEMINEITLAIVARIGLKTLARVIHAYPTQAEGIKKAADAYVGSLRKPTIKSP